MPRELTQGIIDEWVTSATGKFSTRDIWNELGIESTQGKAKLRVYLQRLKDEGKIIALASDGTFRKVDNDAKEINWQNANPNRFMPFKYPFKLEDWVKVYPKSIIIVAGSKNAGKTGFLYNFIRLNMDCFPIDLYNSETGPEQMKERFDAFGDIPNPAPFKVYERYDNFADIIDPNNISVIDYLDFNSEVYLVGTEIDAIFRKLQNGVAIIGLQKPAATTIIVRGEKKSIERDLAYGGAFSAKRAQLYISLGSSRLKLVYVKNPAKKNVNPNNMQWSFKWAEDGVSFDYIQRYYEKDGDNA